MRLGQFDPLSAIELSGAVITVFRRAEEMLGIGEGRREADVIVPVQNQIHDRLAQISAAVNSGNIQQLQMWFAEVQQMGIYFLNFLRDPRFTDGRASEQAANDIMPLIDGSGDYAWPNLVPGGIARQDGGLSGQITRRILALGGKVGPSQISQSFGVPQLQVPEPGHPYLPEAGYLPPTAPLPEVTAAGIVPVVTGALPWLIAGGGLLFLLARRR